MTTKKVYSKRGGFGDRDRNLALFLDKIDSFAYT